MEQRIDSDNIKEKTINLQKQYLQNISNLYPNKSEAEVHNMAFPMGWFSCGSYDKKMNLLKKAIRENKLVSEYLETVYLLHPDLIKLHEHPQQYRQLTSEERLANIKSLYEKGLLTEEKYNQKMDEILSEL